MAFHQLNGLVSCGDINARFLLALGEASHQSPLLSPIFDSKRDLLGLLGISVGYSPEKHAEQKL
jgi:hypothetical protein